MWNFLIGGLGICQIVLYDGSPLKQPAHLWNLVDELGITIFGTSAKYIDELSVRLRQTLVAPPLTPCATESVQAQGIPQTHNPTPHIFHGFPSAIRFV